MWQAPTWPLSPQKPQKYVANSARCIHCYYKRHAFMPRPRHALAPCFFHVKIIFQYFASEILIFRQEKEKIKHYLNCQIVNVSSFSKLYYSVFVSEIQIARIFLIFFYSVHFLKKILQCLLLLVNMIFKVAHSYIDIYYHISPFIHVSQKIGILASLY